MKRELNITLTRDDLNENCTKDVEEINLMDFAQILTKKDMEMADNIMFTDDNISIILKNRG